VRESKGAAADPLAELRAGTYVTEAAKRRAGPRPEGRKAST